MTVKAYLNSEFANSSFFHNAKCSLDSNVGRSDLIYEGRLKKEVLARVFFPLKALCTLVATIALRICSIIEPIIGMLVDLAAACVFLSLAPLKNIAVKRVPHLFRNLAYGTSGIVIDVLKIGVVATISGLFSPNFASLAIADFANEPYKISSSQTSVNMPYMKDD